MTLPGLATTTPETSETLYGLQCSRTERLSAKAQTWGDSIFLKNYLFLVMRWKNQQMSTFLPSEGLPIFGSCSVIAKSNTVLCPISTCFRHCTNEPSI